ncbi:MAG: hypothetical protein O7F73_20450, partial [Gammaproteobacteria bacterium]|nr:hypothetical protein [Gammaproteobacteria bacterium]
MSLILDALHRSDQERNNSNTVPGLQSQHGESAISDSGPRMLLLGLAVMLLAMLLLWVRVSGSPEVPASGSVTSISAETPAAGTPAADVIQRE